MTNKIYTLASGKIAKAVTTHLYNCTDITTTKPVFALFDKTGDEIDPVDKYEETIEQWFDWDDTLDLALQVIADYLEDYFGGDLDCIEIDTEKDGTQIIYVNFDIRNIGFKNALNALDDINSLHDINAAYEMYNADDDIIFDFDTKHDLTSWKSDTFTYYLNINALIGERNYEFDGEYDKIKIQFNFAY